jgi:hypothetical protein
LLIALLPPGAFVLLGLMLAARNAGAAARRTTAADSAAGPAARAP